MALLHGAIVTAIIDKKMEEHGPIIAEVMVAWAEAGVMLNTLTDEEISQLKKQGKAKTCYGGGKAKGDEPCLSHRPQEVQIYGGTYIQRHH